MMDLKYSLDQLQASKSRIEDLFEDLLDEIKDFKCQVRMKVLLSQHKGNEDIEFAPVFSKTKIVINSK